jgi:hypothetical protein
VASTAAWVRCWRLSLARGGTRSFTSSRLLGQERPAGDFRGCSGLPRRTQGSAVLVGQRGQLARLLDAVADRSSTRWVIAGLPGSGAGLADDLDVACEVLQVDPIIKSPRSRARRIDPATCGAQFDAVPADRPYRSTRCRAPPTPLNGRRRRRQSEPRRRSRRVRHRSTVQAAGWIRVIDLRHRPQWSATSVSESL